MNNVNVTNEWLQVRAYNAKMQPNWDAEKAAKAAAANRYVLPFQQNIIRSYFCVLF